MRTPIFSLRFKFTVALLCVSLVTVTVAGMLARTILMGQFSSALREDAFGRFKNDIRSYIRLYGSWDNAVKTEDPKRFFKRLHSGHDKPSEIARWRSLNVKESGAPQPSGDGRDGLRRGDAPPLGGGEQNRPPFRFLLLDKNGRVLMGDPSFQRGTIAPDKIRSQAELIQVRGDKVWAVPLGTPNLNTLDNSYLSAIQQSLFISLLVATVLSLILGMVFGASFSASLHRLTVAVQAVGEGELRQELPVQTRDEVGMLSLAFNRMSHDLAEANDKIHQQSQKLLELSTHDELTGLHNRRHFNQQASLLFAQASRYHDGLTVMIGDIDHFKKINDTFSHATGDEVLRRIAKILEENTREGDVVARYGGEEFVIAFPQTSIEQAYASCQKLRRLIEMYPWKKIHPDLQVTMSMGLNDDIWESSIERMVARADEQLYKAKRGGRNLVCPAPQESHASLEAPV